ncbi:hypothetical protein BC936DRAFT_140004, partial [Jimgerdemannia flammicorona]
EELERQDEERRLADPEKWLEQLKGKRQNLIDKIKARRRRAAQLADRRSHASQMRMRSIASLASDSPASKRRKRGQDEDTFGADDEDWMIYRELNREDESDDEEEDMQQLSQFESLLLRHDTRFLPEHAFDAESSPRDTFMRLFTRGAFPPPDPTDVSQAYQLHVNVERARVPEAVFQPSIVGLDQAGLVETLGDVLKRFEEAGRKSLLNTIFLTGGFTQAPGFRTRLHSSLQSILPAGTPLNVQQASDPQLDAWRGAALWGRKETLKRVVVTRKEYDEYGGEYIKEHGLGNVFR